ncbi:MAG TPA: hypothetical protein VFB96_20445 [Pirellulaceae bacterium]|nr:hypothetical protein [Pirellulaceae bacterium]
MQPRASIVPWHLSLSATLFLSLVVIGGFTLPGCGGCRKEDPIAKKKREAEEKKKEAERKRKKKAEEPKPNFEPMDVHVLPNYAAVPLDKDKEKDQEKEESTEDKERRQSAFTYVKPGHWVQALIGLKANNFDFPGRLRNSPVDARDRPLDIERTNYRLSAFRPAILPKGQAKQIDTLFFLPRREKNVQGAYNLKSELLSARGGGVQHVGARLASSLEPHEYFFVVLASNNSSYIYLNNLRSVVVTEDKLADGGDLRYYRVVLPKIDRRVPLPGSLQAWTMIAVLLWDDIDPALLTQEQRTAMIDWLHWGGQLIVSGPNTLDKLKGSFLAPYLPAQSGAALKLQQADLQELSDYWSLGSTKNPLQGRTITILPDKPMLGVELKMHPQAQFAPYTGNLVAERRIGAGRIAVTSFSLTDLRIRYWKNFDGFFNAVLLRRPARKFDSNDFATLQMEWDDPKIKDFVRDPRLSTTLRIFSRDVGYLVGQQLPDAAEGPPPVTQPEAPSVNYGPFGPMYEERQKVIPYTSLIHPDVDDWHLTGYHAQPTSGVGGWNDFSGASDAARDLLDESAKIEIPKAAFVLKVLVVYLLVLVPLNWLMFWMLGRVEWSWAAAPVIAVVGAVCVIRLAQLNIGFVRSRTEIAVLEVQGDYQRAHVTRYTTLYTSLSTGYQVSFDDPSAVSLPFVVKEDFVRNPNQWAQQVEFHRDRETVLSGIQVNSNSTEKVHSEHMLPLKGAISLLGDETTGWRLKNATGLTLHDLGVIRRKNSADVAFEVAYVSELRPQTMVSLSFVAAVPSEPAADEAQQPPTQPANSPGPPRNEQNKARYWTPWVPQWSQSVIMSSRQPATEEEKGLVRLNRLVDLTVKRLRLQPGEVRLVAWTSDELPGLHIAPRPAQNTTQTLVLAHLARGPFPAPSRDVNISDDYKNPDPPEEPEPEPGTEKTIDATQTGLPGSGNG